MYKPRADCQIKDLSQIYFDFFGDLKNGTFLEIGAFDGETVSNTCFLADMGWAGFYCEPVQEYALKCQLRHINNKVKVIPCAVGDRSQMIEISVGQMISSARVDHINLFNAMSWSKNHHVGDVRKVPCICINQLITGLHLLSCDLVVIDVEGYEPTIIESWDFNLLAPDMFIIETRDRDTNFPDKIKAEYRQMLNKLEVQGYCPVSHDGCNVVLTKRNGRVWAASEVITF